MQKHRGSSHVNLLKAHPISIFLHQQRTRAQLSTDSVQKHEEGTSTAYRKPFVNLSFNSVLDHYLPEYPLRKLLRFLVLTMDNTPQELSRALIPSLTSATDRKCDDSSVFANELPDPDQQLYLQLGQDLDQLDLFPNLPLGVKIWCLMFPRARHMCLDTGYGISDVQGFKQDLPQAHDMPFCLLQARSLCGSNIPLAITKAKKGWNSRWLEYLNQKLPGGLASVRCLQVFQYKDRKFLDFGDLWGGKSRTGRGGLEWFHGLKQIIISTRRSPVKRKKSERQVKDWYQQYKGRVPECQIPQIIIESTISPNPQFWALE
ncbi:uncharacterized protein PAC_05724 [Phialocephala subalpina]|uniref:Uncharacterized protein n=1 Tax=Phialocephala subalpina TaxID=576137 RepID=A0A1L7WSV4_9HELO|nr:uncharacterized protein PAC_05724 [Phialocephala subalpina]